MTTKNLNNYIKQLKQSYNQNVAISVILISYFSNRCCTLYRMITIQKYLQQTCTIKTDALTVHCWVY